MQIKKALKHTNIFVYGCFWGVLDNFRGDIKLKKKSRLRYIAQNAIVLGDMYLQCPVFQCAE